MALSPGDVVYAGDIQETRDTTGAEAGDPVALADGGTVAAVDSEANDFGGVVSDGEDTVVLSGAVVTEVDAAVAEGNRVNSGNTTGGTAGVLIADSAGPGVALSDAGGTWNGQDVPADHAVVYF